MKAALSKRPSQATLTQRDPRWKAVLARDPAHDDHFVYAVRTTGVYCRASSPSRLPRPENVEFFDTAEAAEKAGFRPSRRAAASRTAVAARHASLVSAACRHIERAGHVPTLRELADEVRVSSYHFHRVFRAQTGLTPKEYANAQRAKRLRSGLLQSPTVTDAIYDAGFNSNSRFYEAANDVLGMTAS
ncbi:MAG: bifunctional transcriptional activator/DNA repair enzyme AdaA, partial [Casimicrobiaceae bacterium]